MSTTGGIADFVSRLKLVLPARWFADSTPVLDALLTGFASAWSGIFATLAYVKSQTRIATANGIFLDIAAADYLGGALPRRAGEADAAYSARIIKNLIGPRATRASLVARLANLTGREPAVFEPLNVADTGAYNVNTGYNMAGGYGSANLPYQFFMTAYRPNSAPVSNAGGYGGGPGGYNTRPMFYADVSEFAGTVSDSEIYATIAAALPTSGIAWTQISN